MSLTCIYSTERPGPPSMTPLASNDPLIDAQPIQVIIISR